MRIIMAMKEKTPKDEAKNKSRTEQLLEAVSALATQVQTLAEKVDKAVTKPTVDATETVAAQGNKVRDLPTTSAEAPTMDATIGGLPTPTPYPIPVDYREIVDSVLNRSFEIQIEPMSDRPAFEFAIVVPKKYSPASPEYLKMYRVDRRPRIISYSEGSVAVKEWAERVFNNFNPDVRAMIVADRIQAH